MGEVVLREGAAIAVIEPFLADLVAAGVEAVCEVSRVARFMFEAVGST
jgi:hypothetical protein